MSEVRTPPRRLVDLNPKWFSMQELGPDKVGLLNADGSRKLVEKVGVIFDCPCLDAECEWGGQIAISFENPVGGGPQTPRTGSPREVFWRRDGDTFETLTLSPSIHCIGHWHGFLRNGVLESC